MPKFSTPAVGKPAVTEHLAPPKRFTVLPARKPRTEKAPARPKMQPMSAHEKKLVHRLPLVVLGAGLFEALYLFVAQHMTIYDVIRWCEDQVSRIMG